jgi:polyhydroxyalkanoate synthase
MSATETAFDPTARFQREIQRALQRNIKGWEYLSSPGRAGGVSARTLVRKRGTMNLFHYEPLADEIYRTPLMLVMATSNPSYVFDLLPGQSLVEFLLQRGHDLYVLEWTTPAREENSLKLEDYVLDFIPGCVRQIQKHSGEDQVSIAGYCMGGLLSLMYASLHPGGPLRNLVCFTTPFNFARFGAWNLWSDPRYFDVDQIVDTLGHFPPELFVASVDLLRPVSRFTGNVQLWDNLWNDDFVKSKRAFDKWSADTLPIPGELFRQTAKEIVVANKLYDGALKVGGRTVDVGSIQVPFLHVVAEHDHIVPYEAARELVDRVGSTDKREIVLKGGHVSLIAGPNAMKRMWPTLDEWLAPRSV